MHVFVAPPSRLHQAANEAKETAKASDDSIKNQAVPIRSVKTDRLKVGWVGYGMVGWVYSQ